MSKSAVVIEFFYDVISPYSYLAFEVLCRYKPVWGIDLKLKPMLLGAIMKSSGNSPPAVVPNKGIYMAEDLRRLQRYFQVPFRLPENLMDLIKRGGSLNAQRYLTAIDILKPDCLEDASRSLWLRLFQQHKDIQTVSSFREVGKSIGLEDDVIESALLIMSDEKVKQRLRSYTDEALQYGAFGAPMIVAHVNNQPEVFFGSDRFELLAHVIGKKWMGPVPADVPSSKL